MIVLGIDIGGSGIKGAPVDLEKGELAEPKFRIPTPHPATPATVAATVAEIVRHFNWKGTVGCGLPSAIQNGIVRTAANIDQGWIGIDADQVLSKASSCEVSVCNDADAAGVAEMHYGAGRGKNGTVLLITVGTGLGTALFRDGVLVPNTELGHLILKGASAEKFASAATRDRLQLTYREWAKRFDIYLHLMQGLFWPDLFIIGGGISKNHDKFFPYLTVKTNILPAQLRNNAGIVGAALLASKR